MTVQTAEALSRAELPLPHAIPAGGVVGAEVLGELSAEVALWVWHGLRTVLLWAREEPEGRGELFEEGAMEEWERELLTAGFDPEVRCPLAVLAREMTRPAEAAPSAVSWACLCIADWALGKRAVGTGLAFAEAAALAWPEHTRYAWTAGRLLRAHGRTREADLWLRRAVRLSVQMGDWEGQARSLTALGNLHVHSGNYPRAHDMHRQALRVSRKHRLVEQEGMALHDLFVVATTTGDFRDAEEYARGAFEIYGPGHPRIRALAHDLGYCWMLMAQYHSALEVLLKLKDSYYDNTSERFRFTSTLALTGAGAGEAEVFRDSYREAWELAEDIDNDAILAPCLMNLGKAAWLAESWTWAEQAASRALEVAQRSGDGDITLQADTLLSALSTRLVDTAQEALHPSADHESIKPLARELAAALTSTG